MFQYQLLFSIPIIIHEQTLITGLANKICSWFADKVAISFKESSLSRNPKAILTGNPIRAEIIQNGSAQNMHTSVPTVLITGGNQGSHVINLAVEESLDELLRITEVIHQTGDSKYKDHERLSKLENKRYHVQKWIENMGDTMKKVDLVVTRAGINTLLELAYLGKPALVIPIPYLYQDEQNKNAKYFEKLGLVKILPQNKLNGENLLKEINHCLKNLDQLKKNAQKAKDIIIPDSAKRVALETILLAERQRV